jgi:hypothetical protein
VTRQAAWLLAAAAIAIALVGVYAVAGGTSYKPDASPDPCAPYHWPKGVSGTTAIAEQVGLSALGGAACDLGVSREELTLAFADQGRLDAFEKKHGFTSGRVNDAARAGLNRAVDEGEQAGAFNSVEAFLLHAAIGLAPIDKLISYVRQYLS